MLTRKKSLWGIAIIALFALPLEFLREYVVYRIDKYKLNAAAQRLKYNMTRKEVTQIMGEPGAILEDRSHRPIIYVDTWSWKSAENRGFLWQRLGLSEYTPPLEVIAFFDSDEIFFAIIEDK